MALITENRGRSRYIADYQGKDLAKSYYEQFYQACDTFTYREMVALSRWFGLSLRTIYRWKSHEDFPRNIERMLIVMDWYGRGKPIRLETRAGIADRQTMW
jgi:hypothetical protein